MEDEIKSEEQIWKKCKRHGCQKKYLDQDNNPTVIYHNNKIFRPVIFILENHYFMIRKKDGLAAIKLFLTGMSFKK